MSDVVFAEEMAWLRSVLNRGDFGSHESIQDWIEENIHPAFVDDALQIAANHP
jgi:hypothetical protein